MQKVYLSSTFRDLESYRNAVIKLFNYINSDFPLTCMESYTGVNMSPLEKCLSDVEGCDIYILLVANRYGFIPKDNKQNPHNRSITELEFDTAMAGRKKVLVFMANEGDPQFPYDNPTDVDIESKKTGLLNFRRKVGEQRTYPPKGFTTPQELVNVVSASMILTVNSGQLMNKQQVDENVRYCCNRNQQFTDFELTKEKLALPFATFITNGNHDDWGGNLVNRCGIFSLGIRDNDLLTIAFDEFYHYITFEKNRDAFLVHLHNKIFLNTNTSFHSLKQLLVDITLQPEGNFVVKMSCDQECLSEEKTTFLVQLFREIQQEVLSSSFTKHLYFFINFEDEFEEEVIKGASKLLVFKNAIAMGDKHIIVMPRFEKIKQTHIRTWIQNYVTKDDGSVNELLDIHFKELPSAFRMNIAERSIRQLIKRINEKDKEITDILNS
ncbi:MAG: DUF4062 domain-containing protein [Chitinophagaceae bacterium]